MIKVVKEKEKIKITGHSDYAIEGQDIVCSSTSSIFITTVNAILKFNDKALTYNKYTDSKNDSNDYSEIIIHDNSDITNKLIDNMMELFYDLSKQYPKDIIVKEI